jgi:hypothetical protein
MFEQFIFEKTNKQPCERSLLGFPKAGVKNYRGVAAAFEQQLPYPENSFYPSFALHYHL